MARAEPDTGHARFYRAAGDHPLHPAAINATDCQAPGIARDDGDHPMRHRGERPGPQSEREPNRMICAVASAYC
jgi:hypothetical protein